MATSKYEVEYANGVKRVKLLSTEGAKELEELPGVKSVKRHNDKQRTPGGEK